MGNLKNPWIVLEMDKMNKGNCTYRKVDLYTKQESDSGTELFKFLLSRK